MFDTPCRFYFCQRPVAKMDPKTPGVTYPDFSDQVDVQKIVDASKDQTGLAYALRQINQGRLMPSQLADNAGTVSDVSALPDNVNDAFELAGAASLEGKKVADSLGIKALNEKDLEKIVSQAVEAKFAQAQAQSKKDGE